MPSKEVNSAVGVAPERVKAKNAVELLTEKRAALASAHQRYATAKGNRDEVAMAEATRIAASLTVLVTELEQEAAGEVEAEGRKAAEARLLGIRKAYGSLVSEYGEDEARVQQAREQLAEAIARQNARAGKLEALRKEANGLGDRFTLSFPRLEELDEPRAIDVPTRWRLHVQRPRFEETEDGTRRTRRSYAEIRGSAGFEIILAAGLKAFRALTDQEKAVLEDREDKQSPNPVLAAAMVEVNALHHLGVPAGGIARG